MPESTTRPSLSTATERSVEAGMTSAALPLGRFTFSPAFAAPAPWFTMTELVTMKMMSSTRKMSVSGVMLISAKTASLGVVIRGAWGPCRSPSRALARRRRGDRGQRGRGRLTAARARRCAGPPGRSRSSSRNSSICSRISTLSRRDARLEVVEEDDRLDRDQDARRGRHQGLGDAGHHRRRAAGAARLHVEAQLAEAPHDAGDGAEEADEGGGRADGAEDPEVLSSASEPELGPFALHRRFHPRGHGPRSLQPLERHPVHVRRGG